MAVILMLMQLTAEQVCFLGPELGPLESLLIAPEGGDWYLEEANVSSSRTGHSDRYAIRQSVVWLMHDGFGEPELRVAAKRCSLHHTWSLNARGHDPMPFLHRCAELRDVQPFPSSSLQLHV